MEFTLRGLLMQHKLLCGRLAPIDVASTRSRGDEAAPDRRRGDLRGSGEETCGNPTVLQGRAEARWADFNGGKVGGRLDGKTSMEFKTRRNQDPRMQNGRWSRWTLLPTFLRDPHTSSERAWTLQAYLKASNQPLIGYVDRVWTSFGDVWGEIPSTQRAGS